MTCRDNFDLLVCRNNQILHTQCYFRYKLLLRRHLLGILRQILCNQM